MAEESLILVRANKSRGGGHWSDDDYDVYAGGRVIGRIFRHPQAPQGQPWFWTIVAREAKPSIYNKGYAASREQAMSFDNTGCRRVPPRLNAVRGAQDCHRFSKALQKVRVSA